MFAAFRILTSGVGSPTMNLKFFSRYVFMLGGPLLFVFIYFLDFFPGQDAVNKVLALTAWILLWWITEAVPIAVTSLLPLVLFPMLEILDLQTTAANYASPTTFLYMSGFIFALAMEKHHLHARIALYVLKLVGSGYNRIVLGFMISTTFISMWVNNTATTLLMLPIALSVLKLMEEDFTSRGLPGEYRKFAVSTLLAVAACSNIGGMATIIGTPTNAVLVGFMKQVYNVDITFVNWMLIGVPITLAMLIACYFIFTKLLFKVKATAVETTTQALQERISELGPVSYQEYAIMSVFGVTALGWIFRSWISDLGSLDFLNDTFIGLAGALLLFLIPDRSGKTGFLFDWEGMSKMSWGILYLLGGGVALAKAFEKSGLVKLLGASVLSHGIIDPLFLIIVLVVIVLILKQFIGNTALATLALPMALGIADSIGMDAVTMAGPVSFACHFAFMLPMACAPNAVVFTTGQVKVKDMLLSGLLLTGVGFVLLILFSVFNLYTWMI